MSTTESRDISEMLERIRTWTPGMRIVLARKVLETLESASLSKPTRNMVLGDVVGLLQTATPPPDDEECDRIVEQERVRKYG
jgi:hypothetical protein